MAVSHHFMNQLVFFVLDEQRYALALSAVERVVRVVDITPLPKAPASVLGIVNVGGEVVPVFDLRKRFRLPQREINVRDQLIISRTSKRRVALVADAVSGVLELPREEITAADQILPGIEYVRGVVKLQDGLVLIHDLNQFLSPDEELTLGEAFKELAQIHDPVMTNG